MDIEETPFAKLNHAPAYRRLAGEISRLVLSGKLKHGEPLPTEAVLCSQFGVNRSTVREGIRLLEETGMLRRSGGKRLLVSRPTRKEVGDQLERAMVLHEVRFKELWETAMLLEPAMAEMAALNLSEDELAMLEDNVERTQIALEAGESLVELDIEFHEMVAEAVHNRVLLLTREPMSRLFYPTFSAVLTHVEGSGDRLLTAHREILGALRARSGQQASQWMARHIRDFKRGYEATGLSVDEAISSALRP